MHRHRHSCGGDVLRFMAGRGGPFGFGPRGRRGRGFGGGGGGRDMLRAGRLFGDGELRLIALALIEETPRHGYDIIRALEERSSGFYSPSPGVIYPTLTYLEEAGFVRSEAEGNKRIYSITEAGSEHLAGNRATVEAALEQLERFGRKMARAREWFDWRDGGEGPDPREREMPESLRKLRQVRRRLRAALADALDAEAARREEAIAILENAADALEALFRR
ncbi:DNA-binding PadR family transcriptional regulator [Mesorhizobium sp. J18]|nr:DNA-binding PadR family transcriptional regulator [Mesorhizobium sp. J18]TWG92907.1 DNA-binding PadR family transcriptional regulator [Mesorhizobium sp. J18]